MAIDTEQRRRAAAAMTPAQPVALKPDGTISNVDRQQIGWGYPGIAASTAVPKFPGDTTWTKTGPGDAAWTKTGPGDAAWTKTGPGDTTWARRES